MGEDMQLLEDDWGTIEDVVSFLDKYTEISSSSSSNSTSVPSTTSSTTSKPKQSRRKTSQKKTSNGAKPKKVRPPGFNPNKAREERTREHKHLRDVVVPTLLKHVQELEEKKAMKELDWQAMAPEDRNKASWRQMAVQRAVARTDSEQENASLRIQMAGQLLQIHQLQQQWRSQTESSKSSFLGNEGRFYRIYDTEEHPTDREIRNKLLENNEKLFQEATDGVPMESNLNTTVGFRSFVDDVTARTNKTENSVNIEIMLRKRLPFDVRSTGAAYWKTVAAGNERQQFQSQIPSDETDTILERFGIELHVDGKAASFRVHELWSRRVEEDRVVIIWRAHIDPQNFASEPTTGVQFIERGYFVIEKSNELSSDYALVRTRYVGEPRVTDPNAASQTHVEALAEFILDSTVRNISSAQRAVESKLVEHFAEACTQPSIPQLRCV